MKCMNIRQLLLISSLILSLLLLSDCKSQSGKNANPNEVRVLDVKLDLTEPSYKELFSNCEVIKLDSDPEALLSYIETCICVGDSILMCDLPNCNVVLFSPDGRFLNKIGTKGNGPEDYYLCYDIAVNPASGDISLLNPMGELIDYDKDSRFLKRERLKGKPNYYSCKWLDDKIMVRWSAVEEDEACLVVYDTESNKVLWEDWHDDVDFNFRRFHPFYEYMEDVYFAAPMTNDVYLVGDSSLILKYTWKFTPDNLPTAYLDEMRNVVDKNDKNERFIQDMKDRTLSNVPVFNGETENYYYVNLRTGIKDEAIYRSVFYNKRKDKYLVFDKFREGMTFRPIYMNERFMLCQVPYGEVETYNKLFGLNIECTEDENPLLAKFYFKE